MIHPQDHNKTTLFKIESLFGRISFSNFKQSTAQNNYCTYSKIEEVSKQKLSTN